MTALPLMLVGVVSGLAVTDAVASTRSNEPRTAQGGTLFLRSTDAGYTEALRQHTRVTAEITGIVARVSVEQVFENPGAEWVEGLYVFPLPEQAAVDTLILEVGFRRIVGEIREKNVAERTYRDARESGQRASLVEQNRPNLFRTRVANIGPNERVVVTLGYLQVIEPQGGEYRLRIPLSVTPRFTPTQDANRLPGAAADQPPAKEDAVINPPLAPPDLARQTVELALRIDAGLPLDEVASPSHRVATRDLGRGYEITLADGVEVPDRDFELMWTPRLASTPQPIAFIEARNGYWHLLLMMMPPYEPARARLPRELVFVIDTSGSMHGQSLEQAKAALSLGLTTLTTADRFNVIQFNSHTEMLYQNSVPVTPDRLAEAREYVAALHADGGTEIGAALHAALASTATIGFLRQVVFITDGAVSNEGQLREYIESSIGEARLFTVGIGSAPNAHFMRAAARAGKGTFTFIASGEQVGDRMSELLSKLEHPALTDIELHWSLASVPELSPARIPDLYVGEPVLASARLREKPTGMLTMSGRSTSGYWVRQIDLGAISTDSPGVAALWARSRIAELLEENGRSSDGRSDHREEVTQLALAYGLVSRYTSLVAVEQQPVRPLTASLRPEAVPVTAPHGGATVLPASALPITGTNAGLLIRIGVLLLMTGLFLAHRPESQA